MLNERTRFYLLIDLGSATNVLARLLSGVSGDAWDRRPDPARFTLREMVAHLADWDEITLGRLTQMRDEEDAVLQGRDEGQVAEDHDYAYADPQECLARYRAGRDKIAAFLRGLSPEQWECSGTHTESGAITVEQLAVWLAAHDGYHRQQAIQWTSD